MGNGTNLFSTDGITWSKVQSGFQPRKFVGGFFVGDFSGTNLYTSVDGVSPTTHQFGTNWNIIVYDFAFGNDTLVSIVYNGAAEIWQSDPITNSTPATPALALAPYPGLTITGTVGASYRIEYRDALATNGTWNLLTNIALPSSPWLYFDRDGFAPVRRFYRAVAE